MPNIINYQRNANLNGNDITLYTHTQMSKV